MSVRKIIYNLFIPAILLLVSISCSENEFNPYIGKEKTNQQTMAVFIGNSITANWYNIHSNFFTDNDYINKGVGGETTADFLIRFNSVITDTDAKCVVIMGGINDIITNGGNSYDEAKTIDNIKKMADIAKEKNVPVILCSVLPIRYDGRHPDTRDRIKSLNSLIKDYAEKNNCIYVDYYSRMTDKDDAIRLVLTYDKLHLTEDGYIIMEPMIKDTIDKLTK